MPDQPQDEPHQPWSTGQGIGFLVMLPGFVIVALALAAMLTAVSVIEDRDEALYALAGTGGGVLLGLLAAVPGLIVFYKCKP